MPISQIFAKHGEKAFRALESEALRIATAPIVALGGGALLDEENRAFAEANGAVVVLDVPEEEIARRIAKDAPVRPLGDMLARRRAHYASFNLHADCDTRVIMPVKLRGAVKVPDSKSHLHRLMIADFLATRRLRYRAAPGECEDIAATRRCLAALADDAQSNPVLDCGESGSTLRFLAPVAAALGKTPQFIRRGRLAERPMLDYSHLAPGVHSLSGNVSSQFVTGLLFALPLLEGDSSIVLSSPLESRGYVDMTLAVLREYGIEVHERKGAFDVPGRQQYTPSAQPGKVEADWSAATFWIAANALGANVDVLGLDDASLQPDSSMRSLTDRIIKADGSTIDVSQSPDLFPALAVVAAATPGITHFTGAARLRIKESDRIAAMERTLGAFGVQVSSTRDEVIVHGKASPWQSCEIDAMNDHRIAMAGAIASTLADGPVMIHGACCVAKSYPLFWEDFSRLSQQ